MIAPNRKRDSEQSRQAFPQLAKSTRPDSNSDLFVVVTSAAGFLGRHVAARLSRNYNVIGLDSTKLTDPLFDDIEWFKTDLTSPKSMRHTLDKIHAKFGTRLVSLIHLPDSDLTIAREESDRLAAITDGTQLLLQQVNEFECEQVVLGSSLFVHEPNRGHVFEFSNRRSDTPRQSALLEAESLLAEIDVASSVTLRLGDLYDEELQPPQLRRQLRSIFERRFESHLHAGDPSAGRAAIHVDDAAACIERVVQMRERLQGRETLLVSESEVLSYEQRSELIGQCLHGEEWATIRVPATVAKAAAWMRSVLDPTAVSPAKKRAEIEAAGHHYAPDLSHTRLHLGWEPSQSLERCIPAMALLLKADPEQWYQRHALSAPRSLETSN
jgi:nucleoside-diphosphate-sugar epimerase